MNNYRENENTATLTSDLLVQPERERTLSPIAISCGTGFQAITTHLRTSLSSSDHLNNATYTALLLLFKKIVTGSKH